MSMKNPLYPGDPILDESTSRVGLVLKPKRSERLTHFPLSSLPFSWSSWLSYILLELGATK